MEYYLKKKAVEFRNEWGFGSTDPISLKSLLLKLNVITVFEALSDDFSGMSVITGDDKFMLINANHSLGRQHFTICHELYHLFVDENFKPHHCHTGSFDKKDLNEYKSDVFASYILIPENGVINLIPESEIKKDKITIQTILKIENYFSCSRMAFLFRLKDLKLISSTKFDEFSVNVKSNAKAYGYSSSLYEPGNNNLVIGDYGTIAKQLFDKDKISEGHYVSLMSDIGIDVLNNQNNSDSN